jgi:putative proteasome-type protease
MVFLSDSRTNAGVDHVNTFRKMHVFERPGDRVLVLMTAGNLAVSQAVVHVLHEAAVDPHADSLHNTPNLFEAAVLVGDALRIVHHRDAEALQEHGIEFNPSFILGGQIRGEAPRLFQIYAAGNFVEATRETPYFQIGEVKYGKPMLDRVVTAETPLVKAAKCALISFASTLRSNVTVGMPIDLLIYRRDRLEVDFRRRYPPNDAYFEGLSSVFNEGIIQVFDGLPDPD